MLNSVTYGSRSSLFVQEFRSFLDRLSELSQPSPLDDLRGRDRS